MMILAKVLPPVRQRASLFAPRPHDFLSNGDPGKARCMISLLNIFSQFSTTPRRMADERTFIMIKPDAVHRGIIGDIIKRFEQKGFKLVAMKFMHVSYEFHAFLCVNVWRKKINESTKFLAKTDIQDFIKLLKFKNCLKIRIFVVN